MKEPDDLDKTLDQIESQSLHDEDDEKEDAIDNEQELHGARAKLYRCETAMYYRLWVC